jgi:hypothetical protein
MAKLATSGASTTWRWRSFRRIRSLQTGSGWRAPTSPSMASRVESPGLVTERARCWRFGSTTSLRAGGLAGLSRDDLDDGAMAHPNIMTERMKDGSDAIADWPLRLV